MKTNLPEVVGKSKKEKEKGSKAKNIFILS